MVEGGETADSEGDSRAEGKMRVGTVFFRRLSDAVATGDGLF